MFGSEVALFRAFLVLGLQGCGPKIDAGLPAAITDLAPAHVEAPVAGDIGLDLVLAWGSADDPAGQEGVAALAARSLFFRDPASDDTAWDLGREQTIAHLRCPTRPAACVSAIHDAVQPLPDATILRARDDQVAALAALMPDHPDFRGEAALAWTFEAHPYGHPPLGRTGALPWVTPLHVRAFLGDHFVRSNVRARPTGDWSAEDLAALGTALQGVPAHRSPDRARRAPQSPSGPEVRVLSTASDLATCAALLPPLASDDPTREARDHWLVSATSPAWTTASPGVGRWDAPRFDLVPGPTVEVIPRVQLVREALGDRTARLLCVGGDANALARAWFEEIPAAGVSPSAMSYPAPVVAPAEGLFR